MLEPQKYFPNAPGSTGKTYYVAQHHPKAADTNPGTKELPFKTISKAASAVDMYDTVIIGAGTYREQVPLLRNGHIYIPESLITFKAAPDAEVYLKGSDVFEAEWQDAGDGVYEAKLPEFLFEPGTYNPYELSSIIDEPGKVRPVEGEKLPETLGQIYVDGEAFEQLDSLEGVKTTPESFVVSADGKELFVNFGNGRIQDDKLIELTVRERCFKPLFHEFEGMLFIQTRGMVVEHAANPGAFSLCRPLTIRKNPGTGITVRKTLSIPSNIVCCTLLTKQISYCGKNNSTLISALGISKNRGKTWIPVEPDPIKDFYSYFLDEENGMLLRSFRKTVNDVDRESDLGANTHEHFLEISRDEGISWSKPERIDFGSKAGTFKILKLQNGKLLWVIGENVADVGYHSVAKAWIGTWRHDLSGIDWKPGGTVKADPRQSLDGFGEPHACQFPDGRIFVIGRQSARLPSQDDPGFTSVKLFAFSDDNGQTWSQAKPLTYEDGTYVYSPTSFPDTVCSAKNGRAYVVMNINDSPSYGCDPRTSLQIAEIDTETCCVKKNTVAIIDTKHEEHYLRVRFSNWSMAEDRETKNLLLFMKLDMCTSCPIRYGYDLNCFRYEIVLPD